MTAMRTRKARHPMTAAVIVERIKRDLAGAHPAITAHDTFAAESARVETLPALNLTQYGNVDRDQYAALVAEVDEGCTVTVAAIATLTRWGTTDTDRWWLPLIEQWAHTIRANGQTTLLEMPLLVATRFVYAAGLGAIAGSRYDTLARIFAVPAVGDHRNLSLLDLTDWDRQHADLPSSTSRASRERFAGTVRDALSVSTAQFDTVWQQFEALRITGQIMTSPNFAPDAAQASGAERDERTQRVAEANNPAHRRERIARRDEALRALASTASSYAPHILMINTMHEDLAHGRDRWISPVAQRLIERPDRDLISALGDILTRDLDLLTRERYAAVALRATATYLDQYASQESLRHLGWQPTEKWLDGTE